MQPFHKHSCVNFLKNNLVDMKISYISFSLIIIILRYVELELYGIAKPYIVLLLWHMHVYYIHPEIRYAPLVTRGHSGRWLIRLSLTPCTLCALSWVSKSYVVINHLPLGTTPTLVLNLFISYFPISFSMISLCKKFHPFFLVYCLLFLAHLLSHSTQCMQ